MPLTHYRSRRLVGQFSLCLCYSPSVWSRFSIGIICIVVLIAWSPELGFSEARGRIQGTVRQEGRDLAEQRIMLIRFGADQEVQRTPGHTDSSGRFLFENLETGPAFTYFVGIRYQERLHRSDPITLQDAESKDIVLEINESPVRETEGRPEPAAALRIVNHLMVIVERDGHLEVREVVRIVNTGSSPIFGQQVPSGGASVSLRLPLPQGYYNLGSIQGLAPEYVWMDASGLSYIAPLTPGEHRVIYTYRLPWHGLTTILMERTVSTSILDVLVEDTRLLSTSDLQYGGRITIDPHVFVHFRGINLQAHARSWLQLIPQRTAVSLLSTAAYSLIIGIAFLGIAIPCYKGWQSRRRLEQGTKGGPAPQPLKDLRIAGEHILHSMARLDDQHDHGIVAEAIYLQHRQVYKEKLLNLVKQFQSLQASEDAARK